MTDVSHETLERLQIYAALLVKWQARINLVGRDTLTDMWRRHFLDSAQLLPLVRQARPDMFADGARPAWLDLGAGAGFPGLVLAILGAGQIHLVESNARKCAFMRQVVRETEAPALVHNSRIEELARMRPELKVDVVTSRALAPLAKLIELAEPFVAEGGEMWYLKGQDVENELTQATISWKMQIDNHPSQSDRTGTILRLKGIKRVDRNKN